MAPGRKGQQKKFACFNCKRRKVKCDRETPCGSCIKAGKKDTCNYLSANGDKATVTKHNAYSKISPVPRVNNNSFSVTNEISEGNFGVQCQNITASDEYYMIDNKHQKDFLINPSYLTKALSTKSMIYKVPLIQKIKQPNGTYTTKFYGSFTVNAIFESNSHIKPFSALLDAANKLLPNINDSYVSAPLEMEPQKPNFKKAIQEYSVAFHLQNSWTSHEQLIKLVEETICPYGDGMMERLNFFFSDVPTVTYFDAALATQVKEKFDLWFKKSEVYADSSLIELKSLADFERISSSMKTIYIFSPPDDRIDYSWLSLMASIIKNVDIFTKGRGTEFFKHSFPDTNGNLHKLALEALAFSNYKTSPTFSALLALLTFRLNVFLLDVSKNVNTLTTDNRALLKDTIEVIQSLGIHMKCDSFVSEGISEAAVTSLWNFVQQSDLMASVICGERSSIDYRYCIPRLTSETEPCISLLRYLDDVFLSTKMVSFADMVKAMNITALHFGSFPSFTELLKSESLKISETASIVLLKSALIVIYQLILFKMRACCDEIVANKSQLGCTIQDLETIQEVKNLCEFQIIGTIVFTFRLMKELIRYNVESSAQLVHSFLLLRICFSGFIKNAYYFIMSHISTLHFENNDTEYFSAQSTFAASQNQYFNSFPLKMIEKTIFVSLDNTDTSPNSPLRAAYNIFANFTSLTDCIMELYNVGTSDPQLIDSDALHNQFKFLLTLCLLLRTIYEHKSRWLEANPDKPWKISKDQWKIIIDDTRKRSQKNINNSSETTQVLLDGLISWDNLENAFDYKLYQEVLEPIGVEFGLENDFM